MEAIKKMSMMMPAGSPKVQLKEGIGKIQRYPVQDERSHVHKFRIEGCLFMVILPRDYNENNSTNFPALLFLHGRGEQGYNFERLNSISFIRNVISESYPFVTIIPQSPRGEAGWLGKKLHNVMQFVTQEYRVDKNRIYGTGLAMGGYGIMKFAAEHPEWFAALVPICGGIDLSIAPKLSDIPVWATHKENDSVIPVSTTKQMMKALSVAGASESNKVTIYEPYHFRTPFEDHDAWTETYENPQIFHWLLSHSKSPEPNIQLENFKNSIQNLSISQKIRVKFVMEKTLHYGEHLAIVGNIAELGSWNPREAPRMHWNAGNIWSLEIIVPRKYPNFEWKFVVTNKESVEWEAIPNRYAEINDCNFSMNNKWNYL